MLHAVSLPVQATPASPPSGPPSACASGPASAGSPSGSASFVEGASCPASLGAASGPFDESSPASTGAESGAASPGPVLPSCGGVAESPASSGGGGGIVPSGAVPSVPLSSGPVTELLLLPQPGSRTPKHPNTIVLKANQVPIPRRAGLSPFMFEPLLPTIVKSLIARRSKAPRGSDEMLLRSECLYRCETSLGPPSNAPASFGAGYSASDPPRRCPVVGCPSSILRSSAYGRNPSTPSPPDARGRRKRSTQASTDAAWLAPKGTAHARRA